MINLVIALSIAVVVELVFIIALVYRLNDSKSEIPEIKDLVDHCRRIESYFRKAQKESANLKVIHSAALNYVQLTGEVCPRCSGSMDSDNSGICNNCESEIEDAREI